MTRQKRIAAVAAFLCVAANVVLFGASNPSGATTYSYQITIPGASSGTVNLRSGPGTSYPVVGSLSDGSSIAIACQTSGTPVGSPTATVVWDQLSSGDYVSDYYTNTPVAYGFSPPIPMCSTPTSVPSPAPTTTTTSPPASTGPTYYTYSIVLEGTGTGGTVNERSGPGSPFPIVGDLPVGTSVQIACQTTGAAVGSPESTVWWDQLANGAYISDYYVNTPVPYGPSPPIPQCTNAPTTPAPTPTPTPAPTPSPVASAPALGSAIVTIAKTQVGYVQPTASGTQTRYGYVADGEWCALFARWVWNGANANISGLTAGAPSFVNNPSTIWHPDQGRTNNPQSGFTPQPGDVEVWASVSRPGYAQHVGILESSFSGSLGSDVSINGNLQANNGSWQVMRISDANLIRANSGWYILGYAVPKAS